MATVLLLSSCGSSDSVAQNPGQTIISNALSNSSSSKNQSSNSTSTSTIGNLLSTFLGNSSKLSQSDMVGTWNYTGSDCVFESENLLAKAGGAVASSKMESEINNALAKFGIKEGSCSFTFNNDNTYTANIGGYNISGQYTLNAEKKTVKMTYLAGLGSMTPHITKSGRNISLLIPSDKLLSLVKGVSALSKSSTMSTLSSLMSNYNGMYIGMKLSK